MEYRENKAGDETIQLLRDGPSKNYQNYQSYQDLYHHPLGSLKLLTVPGPKQSTPEPRRFRGNIYLPIPIFREINDYLDTKSLNSLRCTSKSLKSAIDAAESFDPSRSKPLFRIDPNNFLNQLRGIVTNTELSQHIQTLPEEFDIESQEVLNPTPRTGILWGVGIVGFILIFLSFIYISLKGVL